MLVVLTPSLTHRSMISVEETTFFYPVCELQPTCCSTKTSINFIHLHLLRGVRGQNAAHRCWLVCVKLSMTFFFMLWWNIYLFYGFVLTSIVMTFLKWFDVSITNSCFCMLMCHWVNWVIGLWTKLNIKSCVSTKTNYYQTAQSGYMLLRAGGLRIYYYFYTFVSRRRRCRRVGTGLAFPAASRDASFELVSIDRCGHIAFPFHRSP